MEEGLESVQWDSVLYISLASLITGVVYSSVQASGKNALENLELAERLIVQYLTKSEEKGRIFLDISNCSRAFTFGDI